MSDRAQKLVDPVHFFNTEGTPVLTLKHLLELNDKLENEVERLTRLLRTRIERDRAMGVSADSSSEN